MEALLGFLKQFNWIDICVLVLLFRICCIGIKNGLAIELFKLLGALLAIFLSMHYYAGWSESLGKYIAIKNMPAGFLDTFSFIILVILGYLVFVLLRIIFYRFINVEPVEKLNKWGGFILGIMRAILLNSLILFILILSQAVYLNNSVRDAYSGKRLFKVAPAAYSALWNNLASKFMTGGKFNERILEVQVKP